MQTAEAAICIRVLWGSFGVDGYWQPNPILNMDAAEQYRQNMLTSPEYMARYLPRL